MERKIKMEWIIAGVIGLLVGAGGTFGIIKATQKEETVIVDQPSKTQQEVVKQLTNLDLIIPLCDPKAIKENNTGEMCRYLACLQFSRGTDAQTGGNGECERIGNVMNKKNIHNFCTDVAKSADVRAEEFNASVKSCIEFFDRRI